MKERGWEALLCLKNILQASAEKEEEEEGKHN